MKYTKTALGQQVLRNRSHPLRPQVRALFVMVNGERSLDELLAATGAMGVSAQDVQELVRCGLIAEIDSPPTGEAQDTPPVVMSAPPSLDAQARYLNAYKLAIELTAGLGLRGFRLNLAVESAGDLAGLKALAPKIRDAVGQEKFQPLAEVLDSTP